MPETVARTAASHRVASPVPPGARPAVLIVDPDSGVRRMLAMLLNDAGCDVIGVSDADAALDVARSQQPALVLAEVRLPGLSGSALANALRSEAAPAARIVLMSAYPRPPRADEDEFLQKPLQLDRLAAIVAEAVGGASRG